uniref:Peptidase M13 C-terminal domain-containing protein n=1 Tax=Eptatretus burgeri TaxID=7764 RepID=A0A8C4QVV7_EPTBU
MQPPMYNWTYLRSMKFAELGNAIGRAMIRGFYGEGSSHDVNGTSSAFELHCQCFINQYSNYSVKHHFLNGTATLEEHLEDNGGLNIALQITRMVEHWNGLLEDLCSIAVLGLQ